jgi:hypothetical protein
MKEAQRSPVNRCFGGNCPQNKKPIPQLREQQIKEAFITARQRKDANRAISNLLLQLHCALPQVLEAIKRQVERRNLSPYVLSVAIERVEQQRRRNGLSMQEIVEFENFKASLGPQ